MTPKEIKLPEQQIAAMYGLTTIELRTLKQIAAMYGLTTIELRALNGCYLRVVYIADSGRARILKKECGKSVSEIAEIMGKSENAVRLLLMNEEERKEARKLKKLKNDIE